MIFLIINKYIRHQILKIIQNIKKSIFNKHYLYLELSFIFLYLFNFRFIYKIVIFFKYFYYLFIIKKFEFVKNYLDFLYKFTILNAYENKNIRK